VADRRYGSIHDDVGGVDQEGFLQIEVLREIGASLDLTEFERRYPVPALIFEPVDAPSGPTKLREVLPSAERERSFKRTMLTPTGPGAVRYLDQVAFLAKRPNNPFPHMISVGRALNNDIVLGLDTISKFHGYFVFMAQKWNFTDGRSTAGTCRNGEKLDSGAKCELVDGDRIQFGTEVVATFLVPASLHARLRRKTKGKR
jgi:hypothetical protein